MKKIVIAIGLLIVTCLVLGFGYTYYTANKTCVLGMNGYTANVTIKGANADAACNDLASVHNGAFYLYRIDQSQGMCSAMATTPNGAFTTPYKIAAIAR